MAEGCTAKEFITFCSRYFEGADSIFNYPQKNDDTIPNVKMYLFNTRRRPKGQVVMVEIDELCL